MLHVLNGDATRVTLERSGVPGTLAVWADALTEGEVPPLEVGAAAWRETRARFLAEHALTTPAEVRQTLERWDAALERFAEHDEVVIWCEHDLFDQLLLIRHLAWFAERDLGSTTLSLICIGEFPGRPDFEGLGELTPGELASLFPGRATVTARQLDLGRRAFDAYTSDDPRAIERVLAHEDTAPLPFLAPALRRLLEEYPDARTGLARTGREMLAVLAERGRSTPGAVMRAMHARDTSYYVTDLSMRGLLGEFQRWGLVSVPSPPAGGGTWDDRLELTPLGREVLRGERDFVRLRGGIDRWIGGVHLHGVGSPWRWDSEAGRLVAGGDSSMA